MYTCGWMFDNISESIKFLYVIGIHLFLLIYVDSEFQNTLVTASVSRGAKGACAPRGSGAKAVKSACFGLIFI